MSAQLLAALLVLVAVSEQITENLFGSLVHGRWMRLLSIGTGIGVTFAGWAVAAYVPGLEVLSNIPVHLVAVFGLVVGLGGNVVHALWGRYAPTSKDARLVETRK